jgi:hypothetical protein
VLVVYLHPDPEGKPTLASSSGGFAGRALMQIKADDGPDDRNLTAKLP